MPRTTEVPAGWEVLESQSHPGNVYYRNVLSGATQWELPEAAPTVVRVRHILKKHTESRNPVSRARGGDPVKITRSKAEAKSEIESLIAQLTPGNFEKMATEHSDCSSARRGGDLGEFTTGKMQPSFEAASFALGVGKMSGVVESASGLHVILRIS